MYLSGQISVEFLRWKLIIPVKVPNVFDPVDALDVKSWVELENINVFLDAISS